MRRLARSRGQCELATILTETQPELIYQHCAIVVSGSEPEDSLNYGQNEDENKFPNKAKLIDRMNECWQKSEIVEFRGMFHQNFHDGPTKIISIRDDVERNLVEASGTGYTKDTYQQGSPRRTTAIKKFFPQSARSPPTVSATIKSEANTMASPTDSPTASGSPLSSAHR